MLFEIDIRLSISAIPSIVFKAVGLVISDFHQAVRGNPSCVAVFFPEWGAGHPGRVIRLVGPKSALESLAGAPSFLSVLRADGIVSVSPARPFDEAATAWMFVRDRSGDRARRAERLGHSYEVAKTKDSFVLPLKSGSNGKRFFLKIARIPFDIKALSEVSSYGLVKLIGNQHAAEEGKPT